MRSPGRLWLWLFLWYSVVCEFASSWAPTQVRFARGFMGGLLLRRKCSFMGEQQLGNNEAFGRPCLFGSVHCIWAPTLGWVVGEKGFAWVALCFRTSKILFLGACHSWAPMLGRGWRLVFLGAHPSSDLGEFYRAIWSSAKCVQRFVTVLPGNPKFHRHRTRIILNY